VDNGPYSQLALPLHSGASHEKKPNFEGCSYCKLGKTTEAAASQLDGSMERNTSMSLSPESDQSS